MKRGDIVQVSPKAGTQSKGKILDFDANGVLVEFAPGDTRWLAQSVLEVQALRYNGGKPELSYALTFGEALRAMAQVSAYGAGKYDRGNYLKGAPLSQSADCLLRHLLAWWEGEDKDPESGQGHLAHVVWNALRLCQESLVRPDLDDRISYNRGLRDEGTAP